MIAAVIPSSIRPFSSGNSGLDCGDEVDEEGVVGQRIREPAQVVPKIPKARVGGESDIRETARLQLGEINLEVTRHPGSQCMVLIESAIERRLLQGSARVVGTRIS